MGMISATVAAISHGYVVHNVFSKPSTPTPACMTIAFSNIVCNLPRTVLHPRSVQIATGEYV